MKKRIICFCLICTILLMAFSIPVCAYKEAPYLVVIVDRNEMPQGTAYIDLLLPIQTDDEVFVDQKDEVKSVIHLSENSFIEIDSKSEIARYNQNYYSYLFHYKDSMLTVYFDEYDSNLIQIDYGDNQHLIDRLERMKDCKLAFVDDQGNILELSDAFVVRNSLFKTFRHISVMGISVSAMYYPNTFWIMATIFFAIILIVLLVVVAVSIRRKKRISKLKAQQNF